MAAITFHFSSSPTAVPFHLSFLVPIVYILLSSSLLVALIPSKVVARLAVFLVWYIPTAILLITYAMYYIALSNWGLPMDYKMMWRNLPELPYLIDALPFSSSLIYAGILFPLIIIAVWFMLKSKMLQQEAQKFAQLFFRRNKAPRNYLLWLIPAFLTTAVYATPYFQEQINGPFRTIDDPILSLFRLKRIQRQHLIQGVGRDHLEAKAQYPKNILTDRPNVIFIICDALRADHLSGYGYPRNTSPFTDSLIASENTFAHDRYFANTAVSFTGITGTLGSKEEITLNSFMLHEVLKKQGYHTSFLLSGDFISFYNLNEHLGEGIDAYHDGYTYKNDPFSGPTSNANDKVLVVDKINQLENWDGTPQFFYLHFMSTHQGGMTDEKFEVYSPNQFSMTKRDPAVFNNEYDNRVVQLDHYLQQSIQLLSDKQYLKDAIIVITADHGQALMENGHLWHGVSTDMAETYIPFIVTRTGPKTLPPRKTATINDQTDAAPTVLDLLGLPKPASWRGTSIFSDTISGPVYQYESGAYSIISPLANQLLQVTYNKKEPGYQVNDITNPAAPKTITNYQPAKTDSLYHLLIDHFDL